MDRLDIGPNPSEEKCAGLRQANYREQAIYECLIFGQQIVRHYGPPPENCRVKTFPNRSDGHTYYEVAVVYDRNDLAGMSYAYLVESDEKRVLRQWDDQARKDLVEAGFLHTA